jgi:hypothetical protein
MRSAPGPELRTDRARVVRLIRNTPPSVLEEENRHLSNFVADLSFDELTLGTRLEVADIFRDHGAVWRRANAGHVSMST